MTDRRRSPAYRALSDGARRMLRAIEREIGDRGSAAISYERFRLDHHFGRPTISKSLKQLHALGLIDIEAGPRLCSVFRASNRWREIDAAQAARLSEQARERLPQRRVETLRAAKPDAPREAASVA